MTTWSTGEVTRHCRSRTPAGPRWASALEPRRWAEAYLGFAAGERRARLASMGVAWVPVVGWAERGDGREGQPGNSVPRLHLTLGTGPGVVEPFERRVRSAVAQGLIRFEFRHRVDELIVTAGAGHRHSVDCAGIEFGAPWHAEFTAAPPETSNCATRSWSSQRAGSAETKIWCAPTGRHGWALHLVA